jgi:prolipoprotein diacylglyceryltransferase
MDRHWMRLGATIIGSLAVWFAFMIGAIVIVTNLSRQDAITLAGGIAVFGGMISAALAIMALMWVAWYRDRRRRRGR